MKFEKWQALANDYLIIEADELPFALTEPRIRALCAARTGLGADGVALLAGAEEPSACARLRIFNPDGSEAEVSGNGAREAALYLRRHGWTQEDEFSIQTAAGLLRVAVTSPTSCSLVLGHARTSSPDFPSGSNCGRGELTAGGKTWTFQHVQVGNPQVAIRVSDEHELRGIDLPRIGPQIERHDLFPNRTNVSWFAPLARDRIRVRIFERGVGETAASGTGATGAAVAHVLEGGGSPVTVLLDGGQLQVEVADDLEIRLTGWAVPVFSGELAPEFEEELDGLA